jgi:hypothetical protein
METYGPVGADEASAALAAIRQSRARVAWAGYPAWYGLTTGAAMGALPYVPQLPVWSVLPVSVVIAAVLVTATYTASRARGVCEGWTRTAMTHRDRLILNGPPAVLVLAGAAGSKVASWPPVAAAVLVFLLFAGTGLTLSARAARR